MKINCPALGHIRCRSLDPDRRAKRNGAGRSYDKISLALEMGDNVMLYLDDIQHTGPEFLQLFISLCDAHATDRRCMWNGRYTNV